MSDEVNGVRTRLGDYYLRSGADERTRVPVNPRPESVADMLYEDRNTKKHDDGWKGQRDAYVVYSKQYPNVNMIMDNIPLKTQKQASVGTTDVADVDRVQVWCHYCVPIGGLASALGYKTSGIAEYTRVWEILDNQDGQTLPADLGRKHETILVELQQDTNFGMYKATLQGVNQSGVPSSTTPLSIPSAVTRASRRRRRNTRRPPNLPELWPDDYDVGNAPGLELLSDLFNKLGDLRDQFGDWLSAQSLNSYLSVVEEPLDKFVFRHKPALAGVYGPSSRGHGTHVINGVAAVAAFIAAENRLRPGLNLVGNKINGMEIILNKQAMASLLQFMKTLPTEMGPVGLFPHGARNTIIGTSTYRRTTDTRYHNFGQAVDLFGRGFASRNVKKVDFTAAWINHALNNSKFASFGFHEGYGPTHMDIRPNPQAWLYLKSSTKARIKTKIAANTSYTVRDIDNNKKEFGYLGSGGQILLFGKLSAKGLMKYVLQDKAVKSYLPPQLTDPSVTNYTKFLRAIASLKDPRYSFSSLGVKV